MILLASATSARQALRVTSGGTVAAGTPITRSISRASNPSPQHRTARRERSGYRLTELLACLSSVRSLSAGVEQVFNAELEHVGDRERQGEAWIPAAGFERVHGL